MHKYQFKLIDMKGQPKSAEIFIYGDIGMSWWGDGILAKNVAKDLKAVGAVDHIDARINSFGGDVAEGMSIYRLLVDNAARVTTHVDGVAASIASIIAMSGNTIKISEAAQMMIHEARGIVAGDAKVMRDYADLLESVTAQGANIYSKRTGNKLDAVLKMMADTTWMTGDEAVAKKFADELEPVLTKEEATSSMHMRYDERYGFARVPDILLSPDHPAQAVLRPKATAAASRLAFLQQRLTMQRVAKAQA